MGVDTKFVQPQFEVDQDLGNWVFGSSPYLARRNQKNRTYLRFWDRSNNSMLVFTFVMEDCCTELHS
jgi:hypothetical protein